MEFIFGMAIGLVVGFLLYHIVQTINDPGDYHDDTD